MHTLEITRKISENLIFMVKTEEKTLRLTVYMPETLRNDFKLLYNAKDTSMNQQILKLVKGYVEKNRKAIQAIKQIT